MLELFMEEYLRARDRWWMEYADGLIWPRNDFIEHPDADDEEEIDDVGLDDGGDGEEVQVAGLEDGEELQVAEPQGDDGGADAPDRFERPDSRGEEEREEELNDARPPSPPLLQEGPAEAAAPVYPIPVHANPYASPFAYPYYAPYDNPYAAPYAHPYAHPYAAPYDNPYAHPYAAPYDNPYAHPYAAHYRNAYSAAYGPTFGYLNPPFAPLANPNLPPYVVRPADPLDSDSDYSSDSYDSSDSSELQIPQLEPETLGPLTSEESEELFFSCDESLEEDPASPSTSGPGSSRKRGRDESEEDEGPAARRPRWFDDRDSD
ncbi:circumsporozoite protein-like [Notolabrus celidotus]|uniref:circumsporozoite protein-like n=1 Tax=Notolabrus celidotus TaxID=1203425 RepID=UPI001490869C|nr:circumsporozoite protein-like [Notolabrus celidotus]